MALTRMERSLCLRDSIMPVSNAQPPRTNQVTATAEDSMFMHILDCIGAMSCIRAGQKEESSSSTDKSEEGEASAALLSCKHRVFWQAVREIADREAALEDISDNEEEKVYSTALDFMMDCFPDDSKRSDGRLWLPLHLAVSVPSSRLEDIHTLFTANPAAIKAPADETNQLNPCHLAAMMKNPRMEIIQRLQIYDPDFGSSLDSDSNTPLHLALIYSDSDVLVRELAQLRPAALEMKNKEQDTPLHLAAMCSDCAAMVRELAQLHPAALGMKNKEEDTPLHLAARFSSSGEVVRELVALSPAALVTMNGRGETPLAATILSSFDHSPAFDVKLQVLLEAAPQAARIACSNSNDCLPLHLILFQRNPPATMELVAMVLTAYREAVNIPNSDGSLPIHIAARFASIDVIKMIAEENLSNLTVMLPSGLSLAHVAVIFYISDTFRNLRNQRASAPSKKFYIIYDNGDSNKSVRNLSPPLPVSAASDLLLRFLLRHCPGLAAAQDINGLTSYDRLPAEHAEFAYARRLLLLAGASSLYPGVLQEMNYGARREALLLFHSSSSAMGRTIFSRIRNGAGGPELMRTIVCFL